jgi:hypothetical protein
MMEAEAVKKATEAKAEAKKQFEAKAAAKNQEGVTFVGAMGTVTPSFVFL